MPVSFEEAGEIAAQEWSRHTGVAWAPTGDGWQDARGWLPTIEPVSALPAGKLLPIMYGQPRPAVDKDSGAVTWVYIHTDWNRMVAMQTVGDPPRTY